MPQTATQVMTQNQIALRLTTLELEMLIMDSHREEWILRLVRECVPRKVLDSICLEGYRPGKRGKPEVHAWFKAKIHYDKLKPTMSILLGNRPPGRSRACTEVPLDEANEQNGCPAWAGAMQLHMDLIHQAKLEPAWTITWVPEADQIALNQEFGLVTVWVVDKTVGAATHEIPNGHVVGLGSSSSYSQELYPEE